MHLHLHGANQGDMMQLLRLDQLSIAGCHQTRFLTVFNYIVKTAADYLQYAPAICLDAVGSLQGRRQAGFIKDGC